jgi:ATP synthase protein I
MSLPKIRRVIVALMSEDPPEGKKTQDELKALDRRLKALEKRQTKPSELPAEVGANKGYQALGELVGGILGGVGLGFLADHMLGSKPLCMILGAILGLVAAVYLIARSANGPDDIKDRDR